MRMRFCDASLPGTLEVDICPYTGGSATEERADSLSETILIVDDQPENLLILEDLLGDDFTVYSATNGQEAVDHLHQGGGADLVLMDVMMPRLDGFEACRLIKSETRFRDLPILFLTSLESAADEAHGLSLGAEDFIHKPFSAPVVMARVRNHLQLARVKRELRLRNEDLEHQVVARTREVLSKSEELVLRTQQAAAAQLATITALCALAEVRDNETGNHIRRTQKYVRALARYLRDHPRFAEELTEENILLIYRSAPLHDVGKVAIPDSILLKPGRLDEEEWQEMRNHCVYGRNAILQAEEELGPGDDSYLRYAREIAYGHHERWDGKGYPEGLSGEQIPVSARLMAVADVYDALISKRVYKEAFSHERSVAIIAEGHGTHFDPAVADAFLELADEFNGIAQRFADND